MPVKMLREFFRLESAGGILLFIAAAAAILINNSPLHTFYENVISSTVLLQVGDFSIDKDLHYWINDGLMAMFFLLVSLEIKREVLDGQLSSKKQISLPAIAAMGGLILPALIYTLINLGDPVTSKGWAIPAATDIAFALGIITLLGSRVPESLKLTLVSIAIIDDLAAIVIIALFYTDELSLLPLAFGAISILGLVALNRKRVPNLLPYMALGVILWVCILKSGLHATLAGVLVAFFIPSKADDEERSPLYKLEHSLHMWVVFLILPVFALANAGVSFKGLTLDSFYEPVTLGIALGLFFGKQIGVLSFTYLGTLINMCALPPDVSWRQYYGLALLTGIGFTMSLFVGDVAFDDVEIESLVRIGVITASLLSGILGYFSLRITTTNPKS